MSNRIRELNDAFRMQPLMTGRLIFTTTVWEMPNDFAAKCLKAVREFNAFDEGNDPYSEHDFIAVEVEGEKVFAKIDYYAKNDFDHGSEDPADPDCTTRVMTIMLASEY
jgi:hypothetical protein